MKSIKPGRGPSFMGGVMSILIGLFGVGWTIAAASNGGGIFALFGIIFIVAAIMQAVYHFKNATSKNRYSDFDITDSGEETDPFNERFGSSQSHAGTEQEHRFCPYCGPPVGEGYEFCSRCGKKLP